MKNQHLFSGFTNQYAISKTLRFELKPVGRTLEHIEKKGLITQDNQRAEDYKEVKILIDEYHKNFIEKSLDGFALNGLQEYYDLFIKTNLEEIDKKALDKEKDNLRKQIANRFKKHDKFKSLFAKELIKEDLIGFVSEENKELVNKFKNFTTYFTGFHENRKNMYVADDKATAIAYRLIHENLPKFIGNIIIFEKIKKDAPDLVSQLNNVLSEMEEIIQGKTLEEIFSLDYFNETLIQTGIDLYNIVLGGRSEDGKDKIKGLNEYINLYNQKQTEKKNRQPKLKQLYKQILSDRDSVSFIAEEFKEDTEVLEAIEKFYQGELCNYESDGQAINVFNVSKKNLIGNLSSFDLSKVYLRNDRAITYISQQMFSDRSIVGNALQEYYRAQNPQKGKEKTENFEKRIDKWVKKSDYFDIQTVQEALSQCSIEAVKEKNKQNAIVNYFADMGLNEEIKMNLFDKVIADYKNVKDLLNTSYPENKKLGNQKGKDSDIEKIKTFLDSVMNIIHFIKPLNLKDESKEKDETFYSLFLPLFDQLNKTILLYNQVRNYVTKKPYSTEKIKLNFENSTLLDGWDVNKEQDNTSVILRKDGLYYLAIMDKSNKKIFLNAPKADDKKDSFKKMNYKLLPLVNQQLPRVFFAKSRIEYFNPSSKIVQNYKNNTHKKGDTFNINDCHALIDFFKASLEKHEDWKHFNFKFSPTKTYQDLSGFYREVEQQGYKMTFENIPTDYINEMIEEGKLYLFQIYNKDFSPYSKGKPNMHTIYWKMLFDEQNLKDVVFKLNGQAEVFFREKSIKDNIIVHKSNNSIENKNPDNPKKQSKFNYDIIKDKRYTIDKFQFHVPITLNFKATGRDYINEDVNRFLKNNKEVNIIGIDRGERHLAYYMIINQKGEILEQTSFNIISSKHKENKYSTNYHALLEKKEMARDKARKSWDTIGTIKELKEGYISQVVHKIAQLMVKHNAIVVLEYLNPGFKDSRKKVEKQVYQKLEKMLIDKLNYLVFKDYEANTTGGVLKALQLANKFTSFDRLGKQSGFLFYVQAALTSKIDPATGFVNFLYPKYESIKKAKKFLDKFDKIIYNNSKNYFEFAFDYNNFTTKAEGTRTKWVVCTHGDTRYRYNPQTKTSEEVNITQEIKSLLIKHNIQYENGNCFKNKLIQAEDKKFYSKLLHLLAITVSLRHAKSGTDIDFILSPVADKNGVFFDSRKANDTMPKDADANGAYHIALKGLLALNKISNTPDDKLNKVDLKISNKEWLEFAQKKTNNVASTRL